MALQKNVGGLDRLARGVLGVVLLGVAAGAAIGGRRTVGVVAGVVSIGLLVNAATQFCGLNAVLGVDTCSRDADTDP
ncbi:DUF2892 domain-containing protein [Halosolutus amylolyticus]|uniref:DUF2892 domain-containing protein n=1 Tax=Halosolutus amylolyticus TaxID=2932267 RepID=A0ABD5PQP1_9EURY|nr:DUF2892 domain-containing protein [Halosolutus amylolyticus]